MPESTPIKTATTDTPPRKEAVVYRVNMRKSNLWAIDDERRMVLVLFRNLVGDYVPKENDTICYAEGPRDSAGRQTATNVTTIRQANGFAALSGSEFRHPIVGPGGAK
jgi:hypothetical protein